MNISENFLEQQKMDYITNVTIDHKLMIINEIKVLHSFILNKICSCNIVKTLSFSLLQTKTYHCISHLKKIRLLIHSQDYRSIKKSLLVGIKLLFCDLFSPMKIHKKRLALLFQIKRKHNVFITNYVIQTSQQYFSYF